MVIWLVIANEGPSVFYTFGRPLAPLEPVTAFDPADTRRLVGFGSNVFVGRVVQKVSNVGLPTSNPESVIPRTQFAVEVLESIKGKVSGQLIVNQMVGNDGTGLEIAENDALLEPGQRYLFVTKLDKQTGWYHIVASGYANVRIKDTKHGNELTEKFKKASREDVPEAASNP